ncbi:MAG TPA: hypothetical protein VHY08_01595 [Bacillota bacterium]|nr:hypothetical protein [Bacillota bacterium]
MKFPLRAVGAVRREFGGKGKRGVVEKMSMFLQMKFEVEYLRVTVTGKFSVEEAQKNFLEILDAVIYSKAKKILFDGRELMGEPLIIERFLYGEFVAEETAKLLQRGASCLLPFAYILLPPVLDPQRFGENVARRRGMNVKTFDNPEEAFQWLGITSGN